jgi:hypothetical protein
MQDLIMLQLARELRDGISHNYMEVSSLVLVMKSLCETDHIHV